MKKTVVAAILLLAFSAMIACAACGEKPPAAEGERGITLLDRGGILRWNDSGADFYTVYRKTGRFAEYSEYLRIDFNEIELPQNLVYDHYTVEGYKDGKLISSESYSYELDTFGENTVIINESDDPAKVTRYLERIYERTETGQFSDERYAILFKPGNYPDINVNVGFYTTVAGLGDSPSDVVLGGLETSATWLGGEYNHNATCNFWRGVENLTVNGDVMWAVSQATSMRRVHIKGDLSLHDDYGWASGGFIADSKIDGTIDSGSQQQWLTRNSTFGEWTGSSFNMVFVGTEGELPVGEWPYKRLTVLENAPVTCEKPYLTFDRYDGYGVRVPALIGDGKGTSEWEKADRKTVPLKDFYIARADRDNARTINAALGEGKHLFLSAGIYYADDPICVDGENTVVMGNGLATLRVTDKNAQTLMRVADVDGVRLCGILFDAGKYSKTLLEVGEADGSLSHKTDPTVISDLYFRVGGYKDAPTRVDVSVAINSSDVIGDNFWVWRADHTYGVAWETTEKENGNETKNGLVVNGDDVTFYGLMVEHFHEYQTVWNGENGRTYFYQSELPYEVPDQPSWMSHDDTVNGYSSYKVSDNVQKHTAYGIGIYSVPDFPVLLENAVEAPGNDDIYFEHIVTVDLLGEKCIMHTINGEGEVAPDDGRILVTERYGKMRNV